MPEQEPVYLTIYLQTPALFDRDSPSILESVDRGKAEMMKESLEVFSSVDSDDLIGIRLTSALVGRFSLDLWLSAQFAQIELYSQ